MAALAGPRNTKERQDSPELSLPVAASVLCYQGGMAVVDANGRVKPGVTGTGLYGVGRFEAEADNSSGSAGAINAKVRQGVFLWGNSSSTDAIAAAERGDICYVVDDQTVAKTSNNGARSPAGIVEDVTSDGVWVRMSVELGARLVDDASESDQVFAAATELTIASGAITVTQAAHSVDTESDAASDDLDTISGGTAEEVIYLRPASGSRTVVIKHNTGNIICPQAIDISLADTNDVAVLYYANSKWTVVAPSRLAKPGGTYTQTYSTADRTVANPTAAALTENGGAIGGTNDGNLPSLTATAATLTDNSGGAAADGTIAAVTAPSAVTDSTGGTADTTLAAVGATNSGDVSGTINNNFADLAARQGENRTAIIALTNAVTELATAINAVIADNVALRAAIREVAVGHNELVVDELDARQAITAIIDDLQAAGTVA